MNRWRGFNQPPPPLWLTSSWKVAPLAGKKLLFIFAKDCLDKYTYIYEMADRFAYRFFMMLSIGFLTVRHAYWLYITCIPLAFCCCFVLLFLLRFSRKREKWWQQRILYNSTRQHIITERKIDSKTEENIYRRLVKKNTVHGGCYSKKTGKLARVHIT